MRNWRFPGRSPLGPTHPLCRGRATQLGAWRHDRDRSFARAPQQPPSRCRLSPALTLHIARHLQTRRAGKRTMPAHDDRWAWKHRADDNYPRAAALLSRRESRAARRRDGFLPYPGPGLRSPPRCALPHPAASIATSASNPCREPIYLNYASTTDRSPGRRELRAITTGRPSGEIRWPEHGMNGDRSAGRTRSTGTVIPTDEIGR